MYGVHYGKISIRLIKMKGNQSFHDLESYLLSHFTQQRGDLATHGTVSELSGKEPAFKQAGGGAA